MLSKESFVELKRGEREVGIFELWKSYHFLRLTRFVVPPSPFSLGRPSQENESEKKGKFSLKNCHPSFSSSFCGNSSYISLLSPLPASSGG